MNYSIHPEAAQDLADAAAFYRHRGSSLVASRFLEEFERVAKLLADNPGFGTPFDLPRRVYPLTESAASSTNQARCRYRVCGRGSLLARNQ